MPELSAIKADITHLDVDGIVNAANSSLLGGGGVDGAIHRAAGPRLLEACRRLNGCPAGQARITPGFDLPARYVIHTVGPIWRGGDAGEREVMADCYRNCLALAAEHDLRSIAFPAISTGAYGFPIELAANIAVRVTGAFTANDNQRPISILFCCFSTQDLAIYQRELQNGS